MRIFDEESGKVLDSITLMLEPDEARELIDAINSLNTKISDHAHVYDQTYKKSITVLIYTPHNLDHYHKKVRDIILNKGG